MKIINSDIVTSEHDALWADVSSLLIDYSPKPVLIITNEYVPGSPGDTQLKKMMEGEKACNLRPGQYNIISLKERKQTAWYRLRELLEPKIIVLVGILPAQLGISILFKINEPNNFDGRVWLPTLSINELEQNQPVKTQLWNNGMKPIFVEKRFGII